MNWMQNITHAIFFFPGTFLHELLHLLAAILAMFLGVLLNLFSQMFRMGPVSHIRITSFNIIPNFKTGVYGSVKYEGGSSFTLIFVSAAPKLAWVFLWYYLISLDFINTGILETTGEQKITFRWWHMSTAEIMLGVYIGLQLLWAGSLSRQDWHNIFMALGKILAVALFIATIAYMAYSITGVQDIVTAIWNFLFSENTIDTISKISK